MDSSITNESDFRLPFIEPLKFTKHVLKKYIRGAKFLC